MAGKTKDADDRSLVVHYSDDRSERMLADPQLYFADARLRAEREVSWRTAETDTFRER